MERPRRDVICIFQQLQILNILFSDSFASVATPVLVAQVIMMHVTGIYVTVRLHNDFPLMIYGIFALWSVVWFVVEGFLYTMMGKVNHYSQRAVKSWVDRMGPKRRKRLRSFRPLGIRMGNIYVIHRTTVMYIFLAIANFTVQTLLVL